jgi:CheY-like chemotaxis protein/anti-sigma regulatory factor (Ser/Thr protein kinase)
METKKINYTVDTSKVQNKMVMCDMPRLNRVILNLISNAFKFTPEGGAVTVTLSQLGLKSEGVGMYELRVKDSGIGMSPEFAETVFEAYTRDRNVANIQGTGLGMAITKNIVDLMGGNISLQTELGKGTEFIVNIDLPILEDEPEEEEIIFGEHSNGDIDFTRIKLLLVEDNEINREIASLILEEFGFQFETAVNGRDAVEKISKSKSGEFDAILMDIQMPIMNGYEATRAIRQLKNPRLAKIPIIAMTANAFSEDIQRAKAAGMNSHIAKPIDIPQMISTLTEILK